MTTKSARQAIKRLYELRNRYGGTAADAKSALLGAIPALPVRAATDVRRLHQALCFIRAFPDSPQVHAAASALLDNFAGFVDVLGEAQRDRLSDSGIAGTSLRYNFSCEVATWLARRFPGMARIDWPLLDDTSRLDELLELLLRPEETDYFNSGLASTEEWVDITTRHRPGSDFDWLMGELADRPGEAGFWTALYNVADLPLLCDLGERSIARTHNLFRADEVFFRQAPMQGRLRQPKREVAKPVRTICRLGKRDGGRLIDVAMGSLAVRHRETLHFNYADPDEVYLAYVGKGVVIAVTGLLPAWRYPLECTMGFLILSNGVPIGYGGSSIIFRQANTGINIFEEYRGSEAAWLWVQVMRVFHTLSGCTRFIANPYQFGSENPEALQSGAFWFYYRLGYRPVEETIRKLAATEFAKVRAGIGYRTPLPVLRQLATCDMHLVLPGARQSEFFDETWIETASLLATRELAATAQPSRRLAAASLARKVIAELGIKGARNWSRDEYRWLEHLAPFVVASGAKWLSAGERRSLAALIRAKGGRSELDFVKQFRRHRAFFTALKRVCRRASAPT